MCLSPLCFSQAAAQSSHTLAHASQTVAAIGLWPAESEAATAHTLAQSVQERAVTACSFLPAATSFTQWSKQEAHSSWHALHALAHFMKCSPWSWPSWHTGMSDAPPYLLPSPGAAGRAQLIPA